MTGDGVCNLLFIVETRRSIGAKRNSEELERGSCQGCSSLNFEPKYIYGGINCFFP